MCNRLGEVATSWTVTINGWHPLRLNQLIGSHRMAIHKAKRMQDQMVAIYCRRFDVPNATGKRRVTLTITLNPRQRGGDPDAYWKALLDSLVNCGALRDDARQWVELAPVRYERGGSGKTTIMLEDIESEGDES